MYFNSNLKILRKQKGITQKHFSEELNISFEYVKDLETRGKKPSFDMLIKIYEYYKKEFNITLDDLIYKDLSKEQEQ